MHSKQDVEQWLRCRDDEPDARQISIWRQMSPELKLSLAFDMYDFLKEMVRSNLRNEHPEYSPDQLEAVVRERFTHHE
jgi:hypothetical protein